MIAMFGKLLLGLGMSAVIWGSFLYARPAESFVGESSRIVFYHVPMSWVASLACKTGRLIGLACRSTRL